MTHCPVDCLTSRSPSIVDVALRTISQLRIVCQTVWLEGKSSQEEPCILVNGKEVRALYIRSERRRKKNYVTIPRPDERIWSKETTSDEMIQF